MGEISVYLVNSYLKLKLERIEIEEFFLHVFI